MSLEIASLGWNVSHDDIYEIDFYGGESISTFDVVFIDPQVVTDLWELKLEVNPSGDYSLKLYNRQQEEIWKMINKLNEEIKRRKEEFAEMLDSKGGYIVTKFVQLPELKLEKGRDSTYTKHNLSFLPKWHYPPMQDWETFPSKIKSNSKDRLYRESESIDINKKHPFSEYLNFLDSDNDHAQLNYERVIETFNDDWMRYIDVIAKNKVGDMLAAEFPIKEGGVVFLPQFELNNSRIENDMLISSLQAVLSNVSPMNIPEWTNDFTVPGEDCNQSEIDQISEEIEDLKSQQEELIQEQKQYKKYKKLLYGTGKRVLEPVVRDAFELFDFSVADESPEQVIEHEIDGLLNHSDFDKSVIVEISGKSNDVIRAPKFYQLETRVRTASVELDDNFSGLLVGNGYSETEPEEREKQFTDEVIDLCKHRNFVCLTTAQIYSIVERILEEDDNALKREIRDRIVNGSAQIYFNDLLEEREDS